MPQSQALSRFARNFGASPPVGGQSGGGGDQSMGYRSPPLSPLSRSPSRSSSFGSGDSPLPGVTKSRPSSSRGQTLLDRILSSQEKLYADISIYGNHSAREQRREIRQHNDAVLERVRGAWQSGSVPGCRQRPASAPPGSRVQVHPQALARSVLVSPPYVPPALPPPLPLPSSGAGLLRPIDPAPVTPTCTDAPLDSDRHTFETNEEYYLVCSYCGAVAGRARSCFQDDYKDTHDTDSSTARADAHSASQQSRCEQDRQMTTPRSGGTIGGGGTATRQQRRQFGFAQERLEREAAQVEAQAAGGEMDREQRKHLESIKRETSRLIAMMDLKADALAAAIEATPNRIYEAHAQHTKFCHSQCQLNLNCKAARVIANKCFVHTVEQAAKHQLDGVTAQSVALLQEKINNHENFLQYKHSVQNESAMIIVQRLSAMDPTQTCERLDGSGGGDDVQKRPRSLDREKRKLEEDASAARSPSAPALDIQVRDEIARLSAQYSCAVHVRDAARTALNDGAFSQRLKDDSVVCKEAVGVAGIAYLMLRAVEEARGDPGAPSALATKSLRSLPEGLANIDMDETVQRMVLALPDGVKAPSRAEDELYDDCD